MKTSFQHLLKDKERVDYLFREKLHVIQSPSFFTYSLDALLLADFITLPKRSFRYLDFCSGNGIIPLLLSHRTTEKLEGIEIQTELVDMANRTLEMNQLTEQITMHPGDLREFQRPKDVFYDVISCNPPYFVVENQAKLHQLDSHAIARHEIKLSMNDWVLKARQLLKAKGKLYFVHRPERLDDIFETLLKHQFSVNRIKFIYPKEGRQSNLVLVESIYLGGRQGVKIEPPLYVHDTNNQYTKEIEAIYYGER